MTTSKLAYEAAFPDGFVTSVNYVVPKELSDIAEKLEALDVEDEDEDAVAEVRAEIKGIEAGDYTFRFTMEDGCENCLTDEAEEPLPLPLTAAEAQAILYGEYPIEEVFSDLCNEPLGEDFINDLAEKKIFAMNMSIIVAEAVATNSTIILMHGNISLTTLFQVR